MLAEGKNIIIIVADSLRRDSYNEYVKPFLNLDNLPHKEYLVNSCNSCTELSVPWMLSGMEKYSPTMNIPKDLEKKGYITLIRHSNPVVKPVTGCFHIEQDLWTRGKRENITKKYNRLFHQFRKVVPESIYRSIKQLVRGPQKNYLPYARAEKALDHMQDQPQFTWIHLMDPHTPYYPKATEAILPEIIKQNDNQQHNDNTCI